MFYKKNYGFYPLHPFLYHYSFIPYYTLKHKHIQTITIYKLFTVDARRRSLYYRTFNSSYIEDIIRPSLYINGVNYIVYY